MKKGYIRIASDAMAEKTYEMVRDAAKKCDELIVGIPDAYVYSRIYGSDMCYDAQKTQDMWRTFPFVADAVVLEEADLSIMAAYSKYNFDVYFYGTEYGYAFDKDKAFADTNGIEMVLVSADAITEHIYEDALDTAINNIPPMETIVLFGREEDYEVFQNTYGKRETPVCTLVSEQVDDKLAYAKSAGAFDYRCLEYNNIVALMDEITIALAREKEYVCDCQGVLLGILKEFDLICRENNIKYYAICGTLIGALRHSGFIPWDDDLDIAMTREDYNRFKKAFNAKWSSDSRFELRDISNWKYKVFVDCMARVVDKSVVFPTKINKNASEGLDENFYGQKNLDIYILDNAFDAEWKHNLQMSILKGIYNFAMGHRHGVDYSEYERLGKPTVVLMKALNAVGKIVPLKALLWWYDRVSQWANKKDTQYCYMAGISITYIERRIKWETFGNGVDTPFGDMRVLIPSDADGVMKNMGFGDYMVYPKKSERTPKHYFNSEEEVW